ncbi:MAG: hypothetical protein ACREJ2_09840, partial [Planctomycetota bacterium]
NMGWKNGPAVLATCPFYDENGWLPAKTHGFSSQMFEYDGSNNFEFEYGYNEGYRVNVQLRPGEVMTRNWSNKGLQVDMDLGSGPGCLNGVIGQGDLEYSRGLGDLANGRVGNGTIVYTVPLADAGLRDAALEYANLGTQQEDGQAPTLHVKTAGQPGTFVLRMASPYVYLGGSIELAGTVAKGGSVKVSFSRNNGEDWHDIGGVTAAGDFKTTLDLKPLLYRLYDYRLKFELNGVGTGLSALTIAEDMQHSQRALPALGQGSNTITFSAEPQEGTIAVEAHVGNKTKGNQLLLTEFHPQMEGVKQDEGALWMGDSGKGQITIPVTTPGVITHVRFGTHYRARSDKDQWAYELSFDGGKTWTTVDTVTGPTPATCKYDDFSQVPKGSRQVLVRFAGEQRNTLGIFDLSIHVDYIEPHGGFRPVQVTYLWTENGQEKKDVHVAKKPNETYTITCAGKPTMKSLIVELAK